MYKRAVAADKVYANGIGCSVKSLCEFDRAHAGACRSKHSNRSNGYSLVDDRNTEILADILAGLYKILCIAADLVVNLTARAVDIAVDTVKQRNTHCDRSHVKVFVVDHMAPPLR